VIIDTGTLCITKFAPSYDAHKKWLRTTALTVLLTDEKRRK